MKEGLKKPLRAFARFAAIETVTYLSAGLMAWVVARRDLSALDRSFYEGLQTEPGAKIVGGVLALIVIVNSVGVLAILIKGEKVVALAAMLMTGAIASLFFLPIRFSAYGLGGVLGLVIAYKLLSLLWTGVSWPFRKVFGRKAAPPAPQAAADSKTRGGASS